MDAEYCCDQFLDVAHNKDKTAVQPLMSHITNNPRQTSKIMLVASGETWSTLWLIFSYGLLTMDTPELTSQQNPILYRHWMLSRWLVKNDDWWGWMVSESQWNPCRRHALKITMIIFTNPSARAGYDTRSFLREV